MGVKHTTLNSVPTHPLTLTPSPSGGAVPAFDPKHKQQKLKAELLFKWFNAMATAEEKAVLKPPPPAAASAEPVPKPDEGQRRIICAKLNSLVVQRLVDAYTDASLSVPRDFLKESYVLPASGIASHAEGDLKKKGCVPDPSTFASWRKQHEQQEQQVGEASGSGSRQPPKKRKTK